MAESRNATFLMIFAVGTLLVAAVIASRSLRGGGGGGDREVYFYNIETGELLGAPAKRPSTTDQPVVRAHVVACGTCSDDNRQIAYLEAQTAQAVEAMAKLNAATGDPAQLAPIIDAGNVVALPPDAPGGAVQWISRNDPPSAPIIRREMSMCPNGPPTVCSP